MQTEVAQDSSSAYTMWNCTEVTIWHVFMWSLLSSKDSCPGMPSAHLILKVLWCATTRASAPDWVSYWEVTFSLLENGKIARKGICFVLLF